MRFNHDNNLYGFGYCINEFDYNDWNDSIQNVKICILDTKTSYKILWKGMNNVKKTLQVLGLLMVLGLTLALAFFNLNTSLTALNALSNNVGSVVTFGYVWVDLTTGITDLSVALAETFSTTTEIVSAVMGGIVLLGTLGIIAFVRKLNKRSKRQYARH